MVTSGGASDSVDFARLSVDFVLGGRSLKSVGLLSRSHGKGPGSLSTRLVGTCIFSQGTGSVSNGAVTTNLHVEKKSRSANTPLTRYPTSKIVISQSAHDVDKLIPYAGVELRSL